MTPDKWPWAVDHAFLAKATNQIARAIFGDEWLGTEPTVTRYVHQPAAERQAVQRFDHVKRMIAERAASGILKTMWRHTDGGELRAVDPNAWQTERLDDRFFLCQMNLHDPFSRGFAGDGYGYIFVTAESLDAVLFAMKPSGPTATIGAETQCAEWLADEVSKSPHARRQPRAAFEAQSLERFHGLSRRGFTRAWVKATVSAPAWRRAGAPKKS
jgi:hypothetical protein